MSEMIFQEVSEKYFPGASDDGDIGIPEVAKGLNGMVGMEIEVAFGWGRCYSVRQFMSMVGW